MWLMTPFGNVMPALRPEKSFTGEYTDRSVDIQVRARHKETLEVFGKRYCPEMTAPMHFPEHDYPWKAYARKSEVAAAAARVFLDIDYVKFKPEAEKPDPDNRGFTKWGLPVAKGRDLHDCYNSIWSTLLRHGDKTGKFDRFHMPYIGYITTATDGKPVKANPGLCATDGHWYPSDLARPGQPETCADCGKDKAVFIQERDARRAELAKRYAAQPKAGGAAPSGQTSFTYPGGTSSHGWQTTAGPVFPGGTTPSYGQPDYSDSSVPPEMRRRCTEATTEQLLDWEAGDDPALATAAFDELMGREDDSDLAFDEFLPEDYPAGHAGSDQAEHPAHPAQSKRSRRRQRRAARRAQQRR